MKCPKCSFTMTHFISEDLDDELFFCPNCGMLVKYVEAKGFDDYEDQEDDE